MTAAGKINASNLDITHRILIDTRGGAYEGDNIRPSQTKTGEHVQAVAVSLKYKANGRRGYVIVTSAGTFYAEPIQTMILAPEDAAGIKRAHAEALELGKVYEAYPVADEATEEPAAEETTPQASVIVEELSSLAARVAPAAQAMAQIGAAVAPMVQYIGRAKVKLSAGERHAAEVAALRAEFSGPARWDAGRRLAIRLRLAQLSATVYEDRTETPEEYEVDRLRARHSSTNIPAERERIQAKLAALGTVVHPEGSPEYERYRADLKAALADSKAWDFLEV